MASIFLTQLGSDLSTLASNLGDTVSSVLAHLAELLAGTV
jgi:hypothetical protein